MQLPYSIVQSLSCVWLFTTPRAAAHQESLSFTIPHSMLKLMTIDLMMPSNHLILCHPFLLLPSIFPSSRVFSNETAFYIKWPKHWNFYFSITPSNEHIQGWFPLGLTGWICLLVSMFSHKNSSANLIKGSISHDSFFLLLL